MGCGSAPCPPLQTIASACELANTVPAAASWNRGHGIFLIIKRRKIASADRGLATFSGSAAGCAERLRLSGNCHFSSFSRLCRRGPRSGHLSIASLLRGAIQLVLNELTVAGTTLGAILAGSARLFHAGASFD